MSHIDELIREHCPNGVRLVPVSRMVKVVPAARGIPRSDYNKGTKLPIVDQGKSIIAGYSDSLDRALPLGQYVVFGDHTRAVKWVDFQFLVGADGTKVLEALTEFAPKFAYYTIANLEIPNRGYNRHWTILRDMLVAAPPLRVQEEIVRILDTFTELEAELEAELDARKKQYEHYRGDLLAFDDTVARVSLGGIATIGTGTHDTKDAILDGEYVFYARGLQPLRLKTFDFDETAIITAGDGVGVGNVFHFATGPYALHQRAYRIVPNGNVDARYLYHFIVADFARYLERNSVHASVTSLRRPMFLKYPVALPPLEEQLRISSILDKFDALVNDLSIGLPAELEARRKQYQYYRDQLLTFEELAS